MDIIIGGRRHGKTKRCIEMAAESGAYIVCSTKSHVDNVWKMVQEMNLDEKVPYPVTFDNILRGQFHASGCKGFIFDDVDQILQQVRDGVPIEAVSLTDEDMNWPVKGHIVMDDPIQDMNRVGLKEDRKKIEEFYNKVVVPGLKTEVQGKYHDVESPGDSPSRGSDRED